MDGSCKWGAVRLKQRRWMWCMETCELLHHHAPCLYAGPDAQSTRPLINPVPLEQRLLAAFVINFMLYRLYDVRQQSIAGLSSHKSGQWRHHDNWVLLAVQSLLRLSNP
jgi:hypothetical protein